jgi:uncharacterized protein (DUF433 family)
MQVSQATHRIKDLPVIQNPEIVSGVPVFENTRVPVSALFDYLEDDYTLDEFLESFPSVSRVQALKVLHFGRHRLEEELGV